MMPSPSVIQTSDLAPSSVQKPAPLEPVAKTLSCSITWKKPVMCPGQNAMALFIVSPCPVEEQVRDLSLGPGQPHILAFVSDEKDRCRPRSHFRQVIGHDRVELVLLQPLHGLDDQFGLAHSALGLETDQLDLLLS